MIIDGLEKTNSLKVFRFFFLTFILFILFLISAFIYAMSVVRNFDNGHQFLR